MFKITVCLLTFNSERLLHDVIPPLLKIADEIVVVDSGSTDKTRYICESFGLLPVYKKFGWHGEQMNHAISLASNDWVLCIDSDEILDQETVNAVLTLKAGDEPDPEWHGEYVATGLFWVKKSGRFILFHPLIILCVFLTVNSPGLITDR
jgi:glycosyltransferase involved in cell wall biosynthesis